MIEPAETRLALCLLAIAGLILACGTGSPTRTDLPESYADAVCQAWLKHAGKITSTASEGIDLGQREASKNFASQMASMESGISTELAKIEAPSEIADLHAQIVEAHRQAAEAWGDVEKALDRVAGQAGTGSATAVEDGLAAVRRARESEPALPENYQHAIRDNQTCKDLEDAFSSFDE